MSPRVFRILPHQLPKTVLGPHLLLEMYLQGITETLKCLSQPYEKHTLYSTELSRGSILLTATIKLLTVLGVLIS